VRAHLCEHSWQKVMGLPRRASLIPLGRKLRSKLHVEQGAVRFQASQRLCPGGHGRQAWQRLPAHVSCWWRQRLRMRRGRWFGGRGYVEAWPAGQAMYDAALQLER
jgi:hypothetical protein